MKKWEQKRANKRRKKEREERGGRLRYRFSLFGATCIRGDCLGCLPPNTRKLLFSLMPSLRESCAGPWGGLVRLLGHFFGSFRLSWDVFGRLGSLLGRSWNAFWPHFGSLGAPCGAFLSPRDACWAQVRKKHRFLEDWVGWGTQVGAKNP